jgi:PAS domain-containing protein
MDGALEYVSDGILVLDAGWRVGDANGRAELLFGRRKSELVGRDWWEMFPYLAGTPAETELREAAAGTLVRRFRVFHPPRHAWHDVTAVPADGGLSLLIRDVTDVVRARQTEAVRDAIREVVDQAPIAISILRGPEHRFELVNQMARQILGGQNPEGQTVRAALPDLEGQGFFDLLDRVYASGTPYRAREVPAQFDRFNDGRIYNGCFDIVYQPILDVNGMVSGVLSLSVEVTDLVTERKRIERRGAELEAVLSQLVEGVVITDGEGRITFMNEAATRLHGRAEMGVGPERYAEAYGLLNEEGEPLAPDQPPLARALLHDEVVTDARWRIRRPDGTEVRVTGGARPLHAADGGRIAAVMTFRALDEAGAAAAPGERSGVRTGS